MEAPKQPESAKPSQGENLEGEQAERQAAPQEQKATEEQSAPAVSYAPITNDMPIAGVNPPPTADDTAQVAGQPTQPATPTTDVTPPDYAEDVDVIEKEWVEAADKVVEQTKDDPYLQEEAVEDLQRDYLQKRYGINVKKPTE